MEKTAQQEALCSALLTKPCLRGIGHVARIEESSGGGTGRKEPTGRHRFRWEDNIKLKFKKCDWEGIKRINLAQYRDMYRALVDEVTNIQVSSNAGNFLTS